MGMMGGGGFMGGPGAATAGRAAGLPHAEVPGKLQEMAERQLRKEPEHPEPEISFSYHQPPAPPFGLRTFLSPHRGAMVLAAILVVVETLMLQSGPLLTQIGIDHGVIPGNTRTLVIVSIVFLVTVVVHAVVSWARIAYTGRLGEKLMYELRVRVFSHFQRQSLDFFTEEKAGVLMTRMTSDIEALTMLFQEGLVNFAVQGLTVAVITIVLFVLDPMLAAITLLIVLPVTLALSVWFKRASERAYGDVRDRIADVLSDLSESLAGIRVITAHNRRRHNVVRHVNIVGDHKDANLAAIRATSIYAPGTEAIGVIGQGLILLIGGNMVLNGDLSVGELSAFVLYLTAFFAPIQALVQLYNTYQQGQAAVTKLRELLDTRPSVDELPGAADLPPIEGEIVLDHVTFGYAADSPVLHDVSLRIAPGESLAVVGPTGAGKSTIAKLVTRFYDPQLGSVRIDGHDLRQVSVRSLRRQLGVVPQEAFLFAGSIRDNVAFARPDATDDDVIDACRAVGINDLVDRLPEGIHTLVHERGASLSAGERQLLALARAFLASPRVLVLDEATSNLDLRSEALIERALDTVLEGRSAIIIAHRLATAMRADRIAVVEGGDIVELGSHAELVAAGGRYAAMYETWTSHLA
ncbi:MAG: ABC transporter ATP-binding protein [Acidimicrobiales bacterium]|nr:ABC transporter ATP-binding protein [Acidimicrobiales bacterium]